MPFKTNLNQPPYYDDYTYEKDYYAVLFKPGFSVQNRELIELQSILRKQIELFGDNIITRGSIVDGCNFGFHTPYRYVKIRDNEIDGSPVTPLNWIGYFAKSETSGLSGTIVNAAEGFESGSNTNTLYVKYTNSGDDYSQVAFAQNQILRISTPNRGISDIEITNGGIGFSNSDSVVVSPAFVVTMTVGTITEGSYIQTNGGANVEVVSVDSTTLAADGKLIVKTVPLDSHLANATPDSTNWTINENDEITNVGATIAGTVDSLIGSGLTAIVRTSGTGVVTNLVISAGGSEYTQTPTVRIASAGNAAGLAALDLEARNYVARVRVINRVDAVGNGYAMSVSEGVTFFRGAFLRVSPQTIIVSRYSDQPDDVAVGFSATEEIITSNIDPDLLDNATGEDNENAPGADRLRVRPVLELRTISDAQTDDNFFSLVEWSEGKAYKQQQLTSYSKLGDHIAEVTFDHAGDYVLDQFDVTTRSPRESTREGQYYSVVVDPGTAYIQGKKVFTQANYILDLNKGTETRIDTNRRISLNYGNYIKVSGLAGTFNFTSAKKVRFYTGTAAYYSSLNYGAAISAPSGTEIGTARIRHVSLDSGVPGTPTAIYRLYLFDLNINSGQAFSQARSVYAIDSPNGIADIVTEVDGSNNTVATIKDPDKNALLFPTGSKAPKNINAISYTYRTCNTTSVAFAANGTASFDITGLTDEIFPYAGELTDGQMRTLYVAPQINLIANVSLTGTVSTTATANAVVGTGTAFLTQLVAGDYIHLEANSTGGGEVKRVVEVTNNTHLRVHANISFTNASAVAFRAFPSQVPIPFGNRSGLTANVDVNAEILSLHLGMVLDAVGSSNTTVSSDIQRNGVAQTTKTIRRSHFVKLNLSSNDAGATGPWCLGVADVFRLKAVYIGDSGVDDADEEITSDFFVDHNQNPNFLNHSFLYRLNTAKKVLTSSDYLLVEFDYFVRDTTGVFDILSYVHSSNAEAIFINDSLAVDDLDTDANYLEVPDVLGARNKRYDLKNHFDFRPGVTNTVATSATIGSAPTNPAYTVAMADVDFKFPSPDSILECNIEAWQGRTDNILITQDGKVYAMKGEQGRPPLVHTGSMLLNTLSVPPYPGIPVSPSEQLLEVLNTRVGNERISMYNLDAYLLRPTLSADVISSFYQPKQKSMREIGTLERRIEALEYQSALTSLESNMASKVIPSSIDPTINRFKFGFFTDNFDDTGFSATGDSQYSVEMINSRIWPYQLKFPVIGYDEAITFPWESHEIVAQGYATESGLSPNCVPNTEYAIVTTFKREASSLQIGNSVSSYIESISNLTFSNVSAPAFIYFATGTSATKIEVYQNNVLIRTSNDATSLTTADINKLKANTIPGNFFTSSNLAIAVDKIGNNYVRNSGKISWTHDPTSGRSYEVRSYKGDGGREWKYMFEYPIDGLSVGCIIPEGNTPGGNTPGNTPLYEGTLILSPNTLGFYTISRIWVQDSASSGGAGGGGE